MTVTRAFSVLTIKSADDEERVIEGMATTPEVDRQGDVVEPLGIEFRLPLPLLLHHDASQPVGEVFFAKATAHGIPFKARIAKVLDGGVVKDRVDEAWHSVRHHLICAVSIGFSVVNGAIERLAGGGFRYLKSRWLELSLCTIPANPSAVITGVKSIDAALRAGSIALHTRGIRDARSPAEAWQDLMTRANEAHDLDGDTLRALAEQVANDDVISKHFVSQARAWFASGKSEATLLTVLRCIGMRHEVETRLLFCAHRAYRLKLEKRIEALESNSSLADAYKGTHVHGKKYSRGSVVTRDGSLWLARQQTDETPGVGRTNWTLIVKRGATR